jgi:hypothetical protein
MDSGKQIIQYLEELAKALADLQVTNPFHILITGGAYMLLHKKRRFTLDIDFAIIESPPRARPKKVFRTTIQRIEVSRRTSTVPFAEEFKQAVGMVAQRHRGLLDDWLNDADDIQLLIRDLNIRTREQVKAIVDKFLLPDAQEFWEVEEKLDILFPVQSGRLTLGTL